MEEESSPNDSSKELSPSECESCKSTGYETEHHFRGFTKMVSHRKGGATVAKGAAFRQSAVDIRKKMRAGRPRSFIRCESIFEPRSTICHHSFSRPFAFIRGSTIFFGRVGAAGPHRPTGVEEVGRMPTLLEGTASSASFPMTNGR